MWQPINNISRIFFRVPKLDTIYALGASSWGLLFPALSSTFSSEEHSFLNLMLKWLLMDLSSCSRSNELCQWANTGEVWSPSSAATRVVGRTKLCCLQLDNDKRKLVGPKSRWQGKTWLFYTENFRLANTLIRRMLSNAQRKEYLFTEFFSSFCAEQ